MGRRARRTTVQLAGLGRFVVERLGPCTAGVMASVERAKGVVPEAVTRRVVPKHDRIELVAVDDAQGAPDGFELRAAGEEPLPKWVRSKHWSLDAAVQAAAHVLMSEHTDAGPKSHRRQLDDWLAQHRGERGKGSGRRWRRRWRRQRRLRRALDRSCAELQAREARALARIAELEEALEERSGGAALETPASGQPQAEGPRYRVEPLGRGDGTIEGACVWEAAGRCEVVALWRVRPGRTAEVCRAAAEAELQRLQAHTDAPEAEATAEGEEPGGGGRYRAVTRHSVDGTPLGAYVADAQEGGSAVALWLAVGGRTHEECLGLALAECAALAEGG